MAIAKPVDERFASCFTLERPLHGETIVFDIEIPITQGGDQFLGVLDVNTKISGSCPGTYCFVVDALSSSTHAGCVDVEANTDLNLMIYMNISKLGENTFTIYDAVDRSVALMASFTVEEKLRFTLSRSYHVKYSLLKNVSFTVGRGTYGLDITDSVYVFDNTNWTVNIGSFCSLSSKVVFLLAYGGEHRYEHISSYPFRLFQSQIRHRNWTYPDGVNKRIQEPVVIPRKRVVTIGSDVWIGHGARVVNGVTIGHGAVVGAFSTVRKDVPPYAIVTGNPAMVVKYRFDEHTVEALLRIRWWQWPDEELLQIMPWSGTMSELIAYAGLRLQGGLSVLEAYSISPQHGTRGSVEERTVPTDRLTN